jgi:HPr kinase/phosphorylase
LLAGEAGLSRPITSPRIQKPGLALAGFSRYVREGRVQVLGKSEVAFLAELPADRRAQAIRWLCATPMTCIVLTTSLDPPVELTAEAEALAIPLLRTAMGTGETIDRLGRFLEVRLAPAVTEHGVLVDVYGLGVLLLGESGIGKSECALDLIVRGHRLVADDVVEIHRLGGNLVGSGPDLTLYHMELRGIGIINIKELFGVAAVRQQKYVELVVQLDPWQQGKAYDRLGVEPKSYEILGMRIPFIEMPVAPGRHLSVLVEVAARNQLLRLSGYDPAQELTRRLGERLRESGPIGTAALPGLFPPEGKGEGDL